MQMCELARSGKRSRGIGSIRLPKLMSAFETIKHMRAVGRPQ
jgi:hypothetical protein